MYIRVYTYIPYNQGKKQDTARIVLLARVFIIKYYLLVHFFSSLVIIDFYLNYLSTLFFFLSAYFSFCLAPFLQVHVCSSLVIYEYIRCPCTKTKTKTFNKPQTANREPQTGHDPEQQQARQHLRRLQRRIGVHLQGHGLLHGQVRDTVCT